jgi:eukaryotic-like serine/threonine-protein kinase
MKVRSFMQPITTINGRYVTAELLGGGGMAQVFLARDEVLERDVAVKVLRAQYAEDEEFVERFRREALGVASLSHPNIVQVYDRGVSEDGRYYIAMEYVPGGTLKDRIVRDGPLHPHTALALAVQVAEALGAAHERGLIHRDVKPQNVLLTASGAVKVADFGIARAAAAVVISATSAVLGTARYMSPEQAMGREVGPPSDLYSLGVVLYEMLTGEVPFEADTPVATSMKHVNDPPRSPKEIREDIPEVVNTVVLRLLAKDPGARYASASTLVADLDRVAAGLAPAGQTRAEAQTEALRPAPEVPASNGRGPRRRLARLLIPLALLALVGTAGWGLLGGSNAGDILGSLEGATDRARGGADKVDRAVLSTDVEVPDVEELDEVAARKRLDEAGLGAVVKNRRSDEEGVGQVLEQSVPAGKKVEKGSRILLAISSGRGDQQGSAPEPASDDQPRNGVEAGGSGEPPDPEGYGGSGSVVDAASPEPAPSPAPDAGQGTGESSAPATSPSIEPSLREDPAPAPASPEPASSTPSSPEPSSPAPSSPEPSSPGPSSPEPATPAPSSPGPSEAQDGTASPSSEAAPTGSPTPKVG